MTRHSKRNERAGSDLDAVQDLPADDARVKGGAGELEGTLTDAASGLSTGKRIPTPFTITKPVDKSTPTL